MKGSVAIKIVICLAAIGWCLYSYLSKLNAVTKLSMELPKAQKELKKLQEENIRLHYQIEQFENPIHLLELAKSHQYSHLKHPTTNDIVVLPMVPALEKAEPEEAITFSKPLFVIGAQP